MTRTHRRILLILVAVLVINLPVVFTIWTRHQLDTKGVEVTATVVKADLRDNRRWVEFVFDKSIDPEQHPWQAEVVPSAFEAARETRTIEVVVLEGRPSAHRAVGEIEHGIGFVAPVIANVLLLAVVALWLKLGRRRPRVVLRAVADVETCDEPGALLERIEPGLYHAIGTLKEASDARVVLDLEEREVIVELAEHSNDVALGEQAQVRGRIIG